MLENQLKESLKNIQSVHAEDYARNRFEEATQIQNIAC
jgi:hypothetical protein